MTDLHDDDSIRSIEHDLDTWLAGFREENPAIEAVDRGDDGDLRWYVRLRGEAKEHTTIWFSLGQRTLKYEAYVMPAPQEQVAEVHEAALRWNERLVGVHFAIGVEDALFLRGELPLVALSEAELDRIIGTVYAGVERCFPGLIRLGFASRFA